MNVELFYMKGDFDMTGCAVVIGIPVLCFYIGYMIGVRGSKGLAFEFLRERNLEAEFEKWTNKKAGL